MKWIANDEFETFGLNFSDVRTVTELILFKLYNIDFSCEPKSDMWLRIALVIASLQFFGAIRVDVLIQTGHVHVLGKIIGKSNS